MLLQESSGTLAVWLMDGTRLSTAKLIDPLRPDSGAAVVAVTDLDRDGKVDLIFQNSDNSMDVWFMDGTKRRESKAFNPATPGSGWRIVGP